MGEYLEEAAALLRLARDANEHRAGHAAGWEGTGANTGALLAEVNSRRMELAAAFTRLAAVEAALPPPFHPATVLAATADSEREE